MYVKRLDPWAQLPVCAHPGEDLGYDLFSCEEVLLEPGKVTKVRTGIAVEMEGYGFLMRDRSSMAAKGILTLAGVIDAGYRGELLVAMTTLKDEYIIKPGDKIAQIIPLRAETEDFVEEADSLSDSSRGVLGYGSTGQ